VRGVTYRTGPRSGPPSGGTHGRISSTVSFVRDVPVDFILADEGGERWRLADHFHDSVVLLFLRGDW